MADPKNIGSILSQLKKTDRFQKRELNIDDDGHARQTSFDSQLIQSSDLAFTIDMTDVNTFSGIPEYIKIISTRFFETARNNTTDLHIEVPVDKEITPELAQLHILHFSLQARSRIVGDIIDNADIFSHGLYLILGALQSVRVRTSLLGTPESPPVAWVIPFEKPSALENYFALLEYELDWRFLRITIEDRDANRIFLKRIPHRILSEVDRSFYIRDILTLTDRLLVGIHSACQNHHEVFVEEPCRQPELFDMLTRSGLPLLGSIRLSWSNTNMAGFRQGEDDSVKQIITKSIMLLEDAAVLKTLAEYNMIEMVSGEQRLYLDLSRRGACLNISLIKRRVPPKLSDYLRRMPHLERAVMDNPDALDGVRVVFIHHLTSETLGCICALQASGCDHLHGLFIRYKGVTSDRYLEALLSLPADSFFFHSLYDQGDGENLKGNYVLSRSFSPVAMLGGLGKHLQQNPHDYYAAMCLTAGNILFRQLILAKKNRQQVLLIEDGGYMAPLVNRWVLENMTLEEALDRCLIDPDELLQVLPDQALDIPLGQWLADVFPASVEHTRNGYDQLCQVKREYGALAFPAYTMAISDYKNLVEGQGAAMSILMAAEHILNGQGFSLFDRTGVIIGSRGFIGRFLLKHLSSRVEDNNSVGIDIRAEAPGRGMICDAPEYHSFEDIPEATRLNLDLFVGITGLSVLQKNHMKEVLLYGNRQKIFLVSGSTKNIEFSAVINWLQELRESNDSNMDGFPVDLSMVPVIDPLTEHSQGTRIRIAFTGEKLPQGVTRANPCKDIFILADGMPLNFNFFGVPMEIIDRVMAQLVQMSFIGARQARIKTPMLPDIYALDRNIDENGNHMDGPPLL